MKEKKSKLAYETPELTVTKIKMETEFLTATSMMRGSNRLQSNIVEFTDTPAPDLEGKGNGDITLIL